MTVYNNNFIKIMWLVIIFCSFISSCSTSSSSKSGNLIPEMELSDTTITTMDGISSPDPQTVTTFLSSAPEAVSLVKLENLSGSHNIRWEWINPNGEIYHSTESLPIKASPGKYIKEGTVWHKISVNGEKAESLPGKWFVNVYVDNMLKARDTFTIELDMDISSFGTYHALVIGNNDYKYLPALKTAESDSLMISKLLRERYLFDVNVLTNANRADIIEALTQYRRTLTQDDNLLIYYAGHGWLDEDADEGYWLPVDAEGDNPTNWISNSTITSTLKAINAKHVLIVADSCYSGKLTRGIKITIREQNYLQKIAEKQSRTVLSSGGLEPVMDSGGKSNHSVFASALIECLSENTEKAVDMSQIFPEIRKNVMLDADQTPEYADIRKAGHDGGDFIFTQRTSSTGN